MEQASKDIIKQGMEKLGLTKIVVNFSGGYDDGGVEDIQGLNAEGKWVFLERPTIYYSRVHQNGVDKMEYYPQGEGMDYKVVPVEDIPTEELDHFRFHHEMERPVRDEFGSWAGDSEADGKVRYNIEDGKLTANMDYQVTEREYVDRVVVL